MATITLQELKAAYPSFVKPRRVNGDDRFVWENLDGDLFVFETEDEAWRDAAPDLAHDLTD